MEPSAFTVAVDDDAVLAPPALVTTWLSGTRDDGSGGGACARRPVRSEGCSVTIGGAGKFPLLLLACGVRGCRRTARWRRARRRRPLAIGGSPAGSQLAVYVRPYRRGSRRRGLAVVVAADSGGSGRAQRAGGDSGSCAAAHRWPVWHHLLLSACRGDDGAVLE